MLTTHQYKDIMTLLLQMANFPKRSESTCLNSYSKRNRTYSYEKREEILTTKILYIVMTESVASYQHLCGVVEVWRMDGATHALWNTEEVEVVPAMISGTRASSMLSTRGIGAGCGRESSESTPTEEEDAPASSAATSSMTSREPGDSSSPEMPTKMTLNCLFNTYICIYTVGVCWGDKVRTFSTWPQDK